MLFLRQAAAQIQAGESSVVDTIADTDGDFGDQLADTASSAFETVSRTASNAADSIANHTTAAVAASASMLWVS